MEAKIKDNPHDQMIAERKRFESKQKPKPVLAEKLKRRREREEYKDGSQKVFMGDLI